jgi:transglutaminase/protease-like cytokinesis protein 3
MAPPKRSSKAAAARQSKLSFKSKVSKAAPTNNGLKKGTTTSQQRAKSPSVQNIDNSSQEGDEQPSVPQVQLKPTTKEEEAARKISSLRLKQYYASILNSRLTAPGKHLLFRSWSTLQLTVRCSPSTLPHPRGKDFAPF